MPPTSQDQREIDPELRAEIEAAYASIETGHHEAGYAETAADTKIQPFMKSLKTDAVVELTEEARAQSFSPNPNRVYFDKLNYVQTVTKNMNDLRDFMLESQNGRDL